MRAPVPSSSWLNRTSFGETALNSFTGTLTSPKLIAPLQIARGMGLASHLSRDVPRVLLVPLALVGRVAEDPHARPLGEAGADPAGETQLPVRLVDAEEQRPQPAPGPLAGEPPADHEVLGQVVLDLEPLPGAHARLVEGVEPLGHHAFEARLPGGVAQRPALAGVGGGGVPGGAVERQPLQEPAAFLVGQAGGGAPVEPEDVEEGVGDRDVLAEAADGAFGFHVHAALEALEARPAGGGIEGHDLAVEDHLGGAER